MFFKFILEHGEQQKKPKKLLHNLLQKNQELTSKSLSKLVDLVTKVQCYHEYLIFLYT
jgi:hypothetical protein